jgi:hypothetical protein
MKKVFTASLFLLLLLCLYAFNSLSAQGSKSMTLEFFNKTQAGTTIGFGSFKGDIDSGYMQKKLKNDELTFQAQTINGFIISDRLGLGLGLGVEVWKEGLFFPVFLNVFYDFKKAPNTFYANMDIGNDYGNRYGTSYYPSGKGGLLFDIGFGYKMKVAKRLQFLYEAFYRYQTIKSHYTVYYDAARTKYTTVDDNFPYNFFGLRIGIFYH